MHDWCIEVHFFFNFLKKIRYLVTTYIPKQIIEYYREIFVKIFWILFILVKYAMFGESWILGIEFLIIEVSWLGFFLRMCR